MKRTIYVSDPPVPLSRPRFVRTPRGGRAFTPSRDHEAQHRIREAWIQGWPGVFYPAAVPLELTVEVYVTPPKTLSRKRRISQPFPVKRPDLDNYLKQVMDGLNTYAYHDDSQIVKLGAGTGKYYAIDDRGMDKPPGWIISLQEV